jgi:hypothetical protein
VTIALAAKNAAAIVHILEVLRIAQISPYDDPKLFVAFAVGCGRTSHTRRCLERIVPGLTGIKADKSKRRKVTFPDVGLYGRCFSIGNSS